MQDTKIQASSFHENPHQNGDESMENKGEPLALLLDVENILFLTTLK
ncbi:hypothetical protein M388_04090 [Mesotoga sp. Brook.08.YT.4.2.5.4.]|nr:hypothetical protein M388_04090 [Mesotoga sp. Brook.08.YT.4.2.5.4.]